MKITSHLFRFLILTLLTFAFSALSAKEVKILTIGNSYANSAIHFLPAVVKSVPDCKVEILGMNPPGCELERHWRYISEEEKNPETKIYAKYSMHGKARKLGYSLKEALRSQKWDFVTIQQASHQSWKAESFQPYADNIVAFVKKYAPDAEILIQQTWSYRIDCERFQKWGIDQNQMFKLLEKNYADLAKHLGTRIIPTGRAVQIARQTQPENLADFDKEKFAKLEYPKHPDNSKYVVGGGYWAKDKKTQNRTFKHDKIHLSKRGDYMQACLWFAVLFDKNATDVTFVPKDFDPADAKFLRECAQKAYEEYKKN